MDVMQPKIYYRLARKDMRTPAAWVSTYYTDFDAVRLLLLSAYNSDMTQVYVLYGTNIDRLEEALARLSVGKAVPGALASVLLNGNYEPPRWEFVYNAEQQYTTASSYAGFGSESTYGVYNPTLGKVVKLSGNDQAWEPTKVDWNRINFIRWLVASGRFADDDVLAEPGSYV